jgi:predicted metal-binding protein
MGHTSLHPLVRPLTSQGPDCVLPGLMLPGQKSPDRTTVLVCITCRASTDPADAPRKGLALANATTQALGEARDVDVLAVRCLANCNRGLSAAIRREGTWTYVFGDLQAERDGPTLIAGARLLAESTDGLMPWRGRPDPLKRGLVARMPPLSFGGESMESTDIK